MDFRRMLEKPAVAAGIGGGVVLAANYGLGQLAADGSGGIKDKVVQHKAKISLGLGLASAAGLFFAGEQESAIVAGVVAVAAGVIPVVNEGFSPAAPAAGVKRGFGLPVAQRRSFGAPPVQLFGAAQSSSGGLAPQKGRSYSPQAFGGSSY